MMNKFQTALYNALSAIPGDWKVYDKVPYNQPLPYLAIALNDHRDWGIKDATDSRTVLVEVGAWSKYDGRKELQSKMEQIIDALRTLDSADFKVGKATLELTGVLQEEDAMHGIVRMEYKLLEV
jgi:elongation factor P hydroxylase